jgi:secondary thiamine-phosphate synthase enzyme
MDARMRQFPVQSRLRVEMIDITGRIKSCLKETQMRNGICHVFVPHTTAAVTINENADPDVPGDILKTLDTLIPMDGPYRHAEGNSAAHIKASLFGTSQTVFVENGALVLGTWQSVFFCEFDGPRMRNVLVEFVPAAV